MVRARTLWGRWVSVVASGRGAVPGRPPREKNKKNNLQVRDQIRESIMI